MARHVLDYNPLSGETVLFDYKDGESITLTHVQDVTPFVEQATIRRNDTDYSRDGIKHDMWHYARLPNIVIMEMETKHGIKLTGGHVDWKAVFKCINTHYPWLKTTDGRHA
jgi:hypothetical protein